MEGPNKKGIESIIGIGYANIGEEVKFPFNLSY